MVELQSLAARVEELEAALFKIWEILEDHPLPNIDDAIDVLEEVLLVEQVE